MRKANLKQALFTSPQSGSEPFGRYVVENRQDFREFLKHFDLFSSTREGIIEALEEGQTVLLTEPHQLTGYPTYCFECKDKTNTHPSSFHRVE